nr:methyl-accepting chemotaxis protein [uncultured Desulfobacter sp.]
MIKPLFFNLLNRLWIKVMIPISLIIICLVVVSLVKTIGFQEQMGRNQLETQSERIIQAVEGPMFDSLAIGDNDAVRKEFVRMSEKLKGLEIYVYDFEGTVSFSTDISKVGTRVTWFMTPEAGGDIEGQLETGKNSGLSFHMEMDDQPYRVTSNPILNRNRCFHCHGSQRKIIGGITVLSSAASIEKAVNQGKRQSIFVGVAGLVVAMLFVFLFFRIFVNKKIEIIMDVARSLQNKDFTRTFEAKGGDEISQILFQINDVTRDLGQAIRQINENSKVIFDAANELNDISVNLSETSTGAADQATAASAAVEQLSATNKAIAASMEQASMSLNTIASAMEEMGATVNEIAMSAGQSNQITNEVVSDFESIVVQAEQLAEQARDVDVVTDEIQAIAEQVSLLALNAKIEAARAGDAGKGFAVVAQEISDLADETGKSATQANEKLQGIKEFSARISKKISSLSESVDESGQAIAGISAAVEQQNAATGEIIKSITQITEEILDVNNNIGQSALATEEITKELAVTQEGAQDVQADSLKLTKNAGVLSDLAQNFIEIIRVFKV